MRVFEIKLLRRRIFRPRMEKEKRGYRKLYNEELHKFILTSTVLLARYIAGTG
jgi:hypothetical protein